MKVYHRTQEDDRVSLGYLLWRWFYLGFSRGVDTPPIASQSSLLVQASYGWNSLNYTQINAQ